MGFESQLEQPPASTAEAMLPLLGGRQTSAGLTGVMYLCSKPNIAS